MILTKPKSVNAGPSSGTGEGVAHSKRWYVALVRMHHEKKVAERLSGLVGELVSVDGKSKIAVRLNMLGCACVDMPIGYVESADIHVG